MSVLKQFEHLEIPLEAILLATNSFSKDYLIGNGGFGKVYKGELINPKGHTTVAIKRLDRKLGQGDSEFWKEVIMLSVYKHENIVSLLGFCDEEGEKILIYEYASNKSLDLHLNCKGLSWVTRLKICIGAARGLAYLHDPAGTQQRVLHRDMKSSNILVDENWNARIADLGLSKFGPANQKYTFIISNNIAGTIGYCDPLYLMSGILTKESDVYSFGVVLFEVLCGRLCFASNDDTESFTQFVTKHYNQNTLDAITCGNINDEIHPLSLKVFSTIAYQCLKIDNGKRPHMNEVVTELETALRYQVPSSLTPSHGYNVLPPHRLPNVISSSASPTQRYLKLPNRMKLPGLGRSSPWLDNDTELDDQRNAMNKDFTILSSEERSSRAQHGSEKLMPENNPLSTINAESAFPKEFEHLRFGLEFIRRATNNFGDDRFTGRVKFGKVYRGEFFHSEGLTMATVKRLDLPKDEANVVFRKKMIFFSKYRHENLISLQGFCSESDERILMYEYAYNKTLDSHIQDINFTWIRRLKICLGVASGLEYLHNPKGTQQRVVHADIKSANIMLDKNWNAKIAKFGKSKSGSANQQHTFLVSDAKGTVGYCDPMYIETGLLTKESDVYSFGVVLFEVLCSRPCIDFSYNDQRRFLPTLVNKCYREQTLDTIIHVDLRQQIEDYCFDTFVTVAHQCLERDQAKRPSMGFVVSKLQTALEYQEGRKVNLVSSSRLSSTSDGIPKPEKEVDPNDT